MADAQIRAVITAKDEASSVVSGFTKSLDNAKTGSFALLGGLGLLAVGAGACVAAFSDSENKAAQLDAVLRSTAGAAGVTRDAALELSKSLQKQTTYSDEDILSAENLLLTFTKIGKDIFPQATETVLNMATALGEDTKSASVQLGKALQDPILGITALRRVGVNFSDDQKAVIENLVNTGRSAEAQRLILKELNTEFGGSAKAAAETFSGALKQIWNSLNDVMEGIGAFVVEALDPLIGAFSTWINDVGGSDGILKMLQQRMDELQPYFPVIAGAIVGGLVPAFVALGASIWGALAPLIPFLAAGAAIGFAVKLIVDHFGGWNNVLVAMQPVLNWFKKTWDEILVIWNTLLLPALKVVWEVVVTQLLPAFKQFWEQNKNWLIPGLQALALLLGGIILVALGLIITTVLVVVAVLAALVNAVNWVQKAFTDSQRAVANWVNYVGGALANLWFNIQLGFANFRNGLIDWARTTVDAIVSFFTGLPGRISGAVGNAGNAVGKALHIPGFASGVTNFGGGLALVGERGPEVVALPKGSSVIPNDQIGGMGGGGTVNVVVQAGAYMGSQQDARKYALLIADALKDVAGSRNMTVGELMS